MSRYSHTQSGDTYITEAVLLKGSNMSSYSHTQSGDTYITEAVLSDHEICKIFDSCSGCPFSGSDICKGMFYTPNFVLIHTNPDKTYKLTIKAQEIIGD